MSKEFRLKINNQMVNLSNIKGGIKREEFENNQAMLNIFNALDKEGGQQDGVLSDSELTSFFGMVQRQAQKHKSTNLGNREYKHLLKDLEREGINLSNVSKDTFLNFIADLVNASNKTEQQQVVEEQQEVKEEPKSQVAEQGNESDDSATAVRPQKPATLQKVSRPNAWKGASPTEALGQLDENEHNNADKVLDKLLQTYDINPEEVQMGKLKEDLIMYNPSIFAKDGNVYVNVEWSKLDFPKNAGDLYKNGVEPPKVEPRQPVNRRPAAGGGDDGGNGGNGGGNTAVTQTFTTDDIKVTVTKTEQSKYAKLIDGYRKDGEKLHDSLKTGRTEGLTTNNIAYAFQKDIHFGPNSKGVAKKVFSLLYSRMAQLNLLEKRKDCFSYERFSKMSFKEQDALLHNYRNRIVTKERETLRTENKRVANSNARPARQKMLDEANELLVNAANNAAKFTTTDFEVAEENNYIKLKLDDGKYIKAYFNEVDGKINDIYIGHTDEAGDDVTDVNYDTSKGIVYQVGNKYELKVQGYEFGKMQEVAKAIFEKHIPVTPAIKPDENGQYSTDQVKFGVQYQYAAEGTVKRIQQAQAEGEKIRTRELGYDRLSVANAAYSFDDKSVEGHVKEVFGYLRARIRTINKNMNLYTNEEFLSLSPEKQKETIGQYAQYIRNHEQKLLDKAQDKKKAEAEANAQKFYEANKLLVSVANNPPQPDTITYGTNNYGTKYAKVELEGGKKILVYYDDAGSINNILFDNKEDNIEYYDVSYNGTTNVYKNDDWSGIAHTGSFDQNKMLELARKIFGDWKEPEPPAEEAEE